MAVLPIVQLFKSNLFIKGTCLRRECDDVSSQEIEEEWFQTLVKDMLHTMYMQPSGVGLSANQVGVLKKVSVVDMKRDSKHPLILINPKYEPISQDKTENIESCLSFPNMSVPVNRFKRVHVTYTDINNKIQEFDAEGFKAMVMQHEIDHLYGIPHVDRSDAEEFDYYAGKPAKLAEVSYELLKG